MNELLGFLMTSVAKMHRFGSRVKVERREEGGGGERDGGWGTGAEGECSPAYCEALMTTIGRSYALQSNSGNTLQLLAFGAPSSRS